MGDSSDPTRAFLAESEWLHRLALRLVADPGTAGDAAQETLRLAVERDEAGRTAPRSWLAGALRHVVQRARRADARRARRHARFAAERAEHTSDDDVAAGLARLELQRRVLELVQTLDDPYRAAVVLRFVEERTPAEIAELTGVPVKTVYTRLERALARIRERLDREHGGRATWALALVPSRLTNRALPIDPATKRHMLHLSQGLLVAAAVTAPLFWFTRTPATLEPLSRTGSEPTRTESPEELASATSPPASRRTPLAPQDVTAPTTATLVVRIADATSGKPLPAVGVILVPFSRANPFLHCESAVTDDGGRARFTGLTPGRCTVGSSLGVGESIELEPGEVRELVLRASSVWHLTGKVIDREDKAVDDAEIWVTAPKNGTDGWVLARSSADGTFAVPVVDGAWVGARMRGQASSLLQRVALGMEPPQLALRQRARALIGTVVDAAGAPIAGATLRFGHADPQPVQGRPGEAMTMTPPGALARSDAHGRFVFEECEPRRDTLHVRAPGYAHQTIAAVTSDDLGSARELEVVLRAAATVEGRITDGQGTPHAGVQVGYGRYADLGSGLGWTDSDGCYRLDSAPLGPIELMASLRDVGVARATVEGRSGDTVRWDPVMPREKGIEGVVVDERGEPRAGVSVFAITPVGHAREPRGSYADAQGRFRIIDLVDLPHRIEVTTQDGQVLHVAGGVVPGAPPLRIAVHDDALPSAFVAGTFAAPDGAELHLKSSRSSSLHEPRFEGARFESGPWVPGDYELWASVDGRRVTRLASVELGAGERRDLGELRLPSMATLSIHLRPTDAALGVAPHELVAHACGTGDADGVQREIRLDPELRGSVQLAPATYTLLATVGERLAGRVTVHVVEGGETRAEVELAPSAALSVEVRGLMEPGRRPVQYEVRDELGARVARWDVETRPTVHLPPGKYIVHAVRGARIGTAQEVSLPRPPEAGPVVLEL
jgi:RNA polymerase sigma factor (sigma-70 family)